MAFSWAACSSRSAFSCSLRPNQLFGLAGEFLRLAGECGVLFAEGGVLFTEGGVLFTEGGIHLRQLAAKATGGQDPAQRKGHHYRYRNKDDNNRFRHGLRFYQAYKDKHYFPTAARRARQDFEVPAANAY